MLRFVHHAPVWVPAELRVDAEGNTKPGFICVHELENGRGPCGGNVFSTDQEVGDHACLVDEEDLTSRTDIEPRWVDRSGWQGGPDYVVVGRVLALLSRQSDWYPEYTHRMYAVAGRRTIDGEVELLVRFSGHYDVHTGEQRGVSIAASDSRQYTYDWMPAKFFNEVTWIT